MSASVTLPVRHVPSSGEPCGAGVFAFPFVAGALDADGGDAGRVLPEEPHAARTAQVTASSATPINGCLGVFRLLMAFMIAPSPARRAHRRFAPQRELAPSDAWEHPG